MTSHDSRCRSGRAARRGLSAVTSTSWSSSRPLLRRFVRLSRSRILKCSLSPGAAACSGITQKTIRKAIKNGRLAYTVDRSPASYGRQSLSKSARRADDSHELLLRRVKGSPGSDTAANNLNGTNILDDTVGGAPRKTRSPPEPRSCGRRLEPKPLRLDDEALQPLGEPRELGEGVLRRLVFEEHRRVVEARVPST